MATKAPTRLRGRLYSCRKCKAPGGKRSKDIFRNITWPWTRHLSTAPCASSGVQHIGGWISMWEAINFISKWQQQTQDSTQPLSCAPVKTLTIWLRECHRGGSRGTLDRRIEEMLQGSSCASVSSTTVACVCSNVKRISYSIRRDRTP